MTNRPANGRSESTGALTAVGSTFPSKAVSLQLLLIMVTTACAMSLYQFVKYFIHPGITLVQSNLITVLFTSLAITSAGYFVLRKQQALHDRAIQEIERRRAAESRARGDLADKVETRTAQLLRANQLLREEINLRNYTEAELRDSQARHHSFFHRNHDVMLIIDQDSGGIVDANHAACSFYGLLREELIGRKLVDLCAVPAAEVLRGIEQSLGGKRHRFMTRQRTAGDAVREVDLIAGDFRIKGKNLLYVIIRDVSEHRRLEKERDMLTKAVEQARESIFITDTSGVIQYVNPAFENICGFRRAEVVGRHVSMLDSGLHPLEFYDEISEILLNGRTWSGRIIHRKKDETQYLTEGSISPVRNGDNQITNFVTVRRDITEEVKLREQLQQSQKMEAIGNLAGGIAHDFSNFLQAIDGYAELIEMDQGDNKKVMDNLVPIKAAVDGAADLVKRLLTFSRRVEPELIPMDINQQVQRAVQLLEHTIPKMIQIEVGCGEDLRLVQGDAGQFVRVLLNLGTNARDAMPEGGKLTIATENIKLDESFCRTHLGLKPGWHVCLEVRDTGHGIDPECLEHIFEPFFTTKDVGRGTGLGLAMVFGTIEAHGGRIFCESSPNGGTSFKVYLPALEGVSTDDSSVDIDEPAMLIRGSETVLVVDDEPAIVNMACAGLESCGYEVLTANSGEEALQVYSDRGSDIDLLVMDLGMPGMGGMECLRRLVEMDPKTRVLIASGYGERDLKRRVMGCGAAGFIGKPYRLKDLLEMVWTTLNQEPSGAPTKVPISLVEAKNRQAKWPPYTKTEVAVTDLPVAKTN